YWFRRPGYAQAGDDGSLQVEVTSTTTTPAGDARDDVGATILLAPSGELSTPTDEAIGGSSFNPGPLRWEAGQHVADEQALEQLLTDFLEETAFPQFLRNLEARLAATILGDVGRNLGPGGLPAGVVLSLRSLKLSEGELELRGALGAFGGVISK